MNENTQDAPNILIVDDDSLDRRFIADALLEAKPEIKISERSDGRQGIDAIMDQRFDLVFLDLKMPKMSGTDVLLRLQDDNVDAGCPVLVLTTSSDPNEIASARNAGADGCLKKPFSRDGYRALANAVFERWLNSES